MLVNDLKIMKRIMNIALKRRIRVRQALSMRSTQYKISLIFFTVRLCYKFFSLLSDATPCYE